MLRHPATGPTQLTSSEVAALAGISVATVKRWAETGLLPSERTPGGHRRYRREDVDALLRAATPPGDAVTRRAEEILAARTPLELQGGLLRDRAAAGAWGPAFDALGPVYSELLGRHREGRLTALQWLSALDRLRAAIARFLDAPPPLLGAPRLVVAAVPGDRVLFVPAMFALVAAEAGWAPRLVGPATAAELVEELGREPAEALFVSASADSQAGAVAAFARALAAAPRVARRSLAVGGFGAWPEPLPAGERLLSFEDARAWLERQRAAWSARPTCLVEEGAAAADGLLAWSPALAIGDPIVDAQHETLFGNVRRFSEALRAGAPPEEIARLLDFVEDYVEIHFRVEEGLMRAAGYPALEAHAAEHAAFGARIRALSARPPGRLPSPEALRAIAELLCGWLSAHIAGSDQRIGPHLLGAAAPAG